MNIIDRAAIIEQAGKCICDCHHSDTPDLEHGHVSEECPCQPLELRVDSVLNRALIEYGLHESKFSAGIRDSIVAVFETARPAIAKALLAPIQEYLFELHADIEWTTDHFLPGPNSEAYVADRRKLLAELGALLDALEAAK